MKRTHEYIARGVCVRRGRLLTCRSRTGRVRYLPGGHVEWNEPAAGALEREIAEELGRSARAGRFLGCVEHAFDQEGRRHCEINVLFRLFIRGLDPSRPVIAREAGLAFEWIPVAFLARSGLEPAPLRRRLSAWLKRPGGWAGTLPRKGIGP